MSIPQIQLRPTLLTKCGPFDIGVGQAIREMHHAPRVGAMAQAIGMPQLVNRFFYGPLLEKHLIFG
jgi:hypothetical protein